LSENLRPKKLLEAEVQYLKDAGWVLTEYDWDDYVWHEPNAVECGGTITQWDHESALKIQYYLENPKPIYDDEGDE
jgi:hypothetical protein